MVKMILEQEQKLINAKHYGIETYNYLIKFLLDITAYYMYTQKRNRVLYSRYYKINVHSQ